MATVKKPAAGSPEIFVMEIERGEVEFCVIGTSPLICNRMSEKARGDLLLGGGKKTAAEKAGRAKHDPLAEYRSSPYTNIEDGPTRIQGLGSWFKQAMMTAALDTPGAKKAQIGRLVYVMGDRVDIYGVPKLMMAITRSADINKTPDVRTRAILPRWACVVRVSFAKPIINAQSIATLLASGGITSGVGDWRIQKGSGSYGAYRLCAKDDPEFVAILKHGRKAQDEALESPECYDDETRDLLSWYDVEVKRRGLKVA